MFGHRILSLVTTLFLFLSLFSCQKKSEVHYQKSRAEIDPAPLTISKVDVIDWKVGPKRDQTIARGVSLTIELPQLKGSDLKRIVSDRNADAWLVQLHRSGTTGMEVLARAAIPLTGYSNQMKTASFPVLYAASALSMRRAEMRCPSFDHRYIIGDVSVESTSAPGLKKLIAGPSQDKPQRGQFELFQMRPESINGGHRLEGDYRFEIALLNRKQKRLKSNFVNFSEVVRIKNEKKVTLNGCENYREKNQRGSPGYDEFRFGR